MKVYIVEAMRSDDYDNNSWIVKAFRNKEQAGKYKLNMEAEPVWESYEELIYIITEQELE